MFTLPFQVISDLNRLFACFWWGDNGSKKRIHWKAWKDLCFSKADGGMGFKEIRCFNVVLLARQWWRISTNPSLLSHQVLRAKYFYGTDLLHDG